MKEPMRYLTLACILGGGFFLGTHLPGCVAEEEEGRYVPLSTLDDSEVEVEGAYNYTLSDSESLIYLQVFAVPGTAGHDHVIRAADYSGDAVFDSNDITACSVSLELVAKSLQADEDYMREEVGYDENLSGTTQASVESTMLGDTQLDADKYPKLSFTSSSCEMNGDGMNVTGDLSIHGQTNQKTIEFTEAYTTAAGFIAKGTIDFTQSEFGVVPYTQFGLYENADEVVLTLEILAIRDE